MKCVCVWLGSVGRWGGVLVGDRIGFGLYQSCMNREVCDVCPCLGYGSVCGVGDEWVVIWARVMRGCCCVMTVCVVGLDYLCRWLVQISVYCARRIPVHCMYTQCLILLYHIADICFLTCICLWQLSQILTCLRVVVGPGLVSISPTFVRSSVSHPAGLHGWFAQKTR